MILSRTRNDSSTHGKPRVFFAAHPDDFDLYFDRLSTDILDLQNCAIWYESDPQATEYDPVSLNEMQLFVLPVTRRFLYQENAARQVILDYAIKNHKPILPVLMERGLASEFNSICGDLQTVNAQSTDSTEKPYKQRLKEFLEAILIGDELSDKIRNAFDAYIFLSYRKIDREFAQKLMRLIHRNDFCKDIAIWYDEFLVPGESFNNAIKDALEKSPLFALVVTPSLLQKNAHGKPNYVMETEYPMAHDANKTILAFEMAATDHDSLRSKFEGLDAERCIDPENEESMRERLSEALRLIAIKPGEKDAEHDFFIGLAYLGGIDVEVDTEMAVRLIKGAAEAGLPEAVDKLVHMYRYGEGVGRDYEEAIRQQIRKKDLLYAKFTDGPTEGTASAYVNSLGELGDYLLEARHFQKAEEAYTTLCDFCTANTRFPHASQAGLLVGYDRLGRLFREQNQGIRSGEYLKRTMEILNQALVLEPNNLDVLAMLGTAHNNYGRSLLLDNRLEVARRQFEKALEQFQRLDDLESTPQSRRGLSCTLSYIGNVCDMKGNYAEAMRYFEKMRDINYSLKEELRTTESKLDYAISYYKIACVCEHLGNSVKAISLMDISMRMCMELARETETFEVYFSIVNCANSLLGKLFDSGDRNRLEECARIRLDAAEKMYEIYPSVQSTRELRDAYSFIGEFLRGEGRLNEAVPCFLTATAKSKDVLEKEETPEDLDKLALNYMLLALASEKPFYAQRSVEVWDSLCRSVPFSDPARERYQYYRQLAQQVLNGQ